MIDNENDGSDVLDNLKQVQDGVSRLNRTIEKMKGEFNTHFETKS